MTFGLFLNVAGALVIKGQNLPDALTIDQAVLIAERNAFAVRIQNAAVEKDRQAITVALSALGPTVGLTTVFSQNGQAITTSFGQGTAPVVVSPFNTANTSLSVNLPLDISGNLTRLYSASRASYDAAKRSLEASFNDARLNARTSYLAVLRDKALVVVAQEAVKDAQDRLKQSQLELEQKQVAKVDVDRLDAQLAQSNSDLLNAQNNLHLAEQSLNFTLARPIDTPLVLQEIDSNPEIPKDMDFIDKRAQQNRPDALALLNQIKALGLIRRAQEAGLNPSMAVGLAYGRDINPTLFSGNPNSVTGTVTLNIPIYDSGATRAKVSEARQDELTAKIQLQQVQLSISQDVRSAITNMSSAQARLANANRQVTLAEEVYRLAKVRQDAGEGTYVEVVDAESSLEQARNGVVSARYDYLQAYSQLQHAVGNDHVEESAKTQPNPMPSIPVPANPSQTRGVKN